MERSVIFISEFQERLSGAIASFNSMAEPFIWTFPTIYSLPEECLTMFQSPVPIQVGLKIASKEFLKRIGPQYYGDLTAQKDTVFVFLDYGIVLTNSNQVKSTLVPFFQDFLVILGAIYKKHFHEKSSNFLKISKKKGKNNQKKYSLSKQNRFSFKEKLNKINKGKQAIIPNANKMINNNENTHKEVFSYMKDVFKRQVISKLPKYNQVSPTKSSISSYDFIQKIKTETFSQNYFDQIFIEKLFSTQSFNLFLESEHFKGLT
jgi:hypothetical protein